MRTNHVIAAAAACALLAGCTTTEAKLGANRSGGLANDRAAASSAMRAGFAGKASYYSHAGRTATGAKFNPHGLTAAHRSLPFGTKLRVSDPKSGRSVVVTVNDRGPFTGGRVLDLSLGAARVLGMTGRGVMQVQAERL